MKKYIRVLAVCALASLLSYAVTNAAVKRVKKNRRPAVIQAVPASPTYGCKLTVATNGTSYDNFYSIAYSYWVPTCSSALTSTPCTGCVLVTLFSNEGGSYVPIYSTCIDAGSLQCDTSNPNCTAQLSGIRQTYGPGDYKVIWKFCPGGCTNPGTALATQTQTFTVTNL